MLKSVDLLSVIGALVQFSLKTAVLLASEISENVSNKMLQLG